MHPLASFDGERLLQLRVGLGGRPSAASAAPRLYRHSASSPNIRGRVSSANRAEPVAEEPLGVGRAAGPQRRRSRFEPHQTVARIAFPQRRQLLQRIVVPLFAVVEQDQREARLGLIVAAVGGGVLDLLDALLLAAAEAGDVGDHAQRQRQRRDDVAVGADDQAGVLALRLRARAPSPLRRRPRARRGRRRARCRPPSRCRRRAGRRRRRADSARRRPSGSARSVPGRARSPCRSHPGTPVDGVGRRRRQRVRVRLVRAAEIVVDRHVAAAERDAQPQRRSRDRGTRRHPAGRRRPPAGTSPAPGRARDCRYRRPPCARSASDSGFAARRRRRRAATSAASTAARARFQTGHAADLTPARQLAPLVPFTYNRPRLWTKPAFIRAASTRTSHTDSHERAPRGAGVLAEVRLLGRSQSDRHPVHDHRRSCSCCSASR